MLDLKTPVPVKVETYLNVMCLQFKCHFTDLIVLTVFSDHWAK